MSIYLKLFGVATILVMFVTVDVTIRRLREKLKDTPSRPEYILTRRGVGYYMKNYD